jgi:hypothetical protein
MYESGELTAGQLKKASSQLAGMTLRDFFAAKAMQGYVARGKAYDFEDIAKASYRVADAMLKARDV